MDGGCERDVVHRMNEAYYSLESTAERCAEQLIIEDKCEKITIWSSNCTNGAVRIGIIEYEKWRENETECSWNEVFKKFGAWECHEWKEKEEWRGA